MVLDYFKCPENLVYCEQTDECKRTTFECPLKTCENNLNGLVYTCPNGACALSEDYCDYDNGCSFYIPY